MFACCRFCKPLSRAYEALWSPSCDSTWSLTSARAACTGGAEKFGSPARKTFFDSMAPNRPLGQALSCNGRSCIGNDDRHNPSKTKLVESALLALEI
jgi:hypothetical protein